MILIAKHSIDNLITKGKHYECNFDLLLNSVVGRNEYFIHGDSGISIYLSNTNILPTMIDIGNFHTLKELRDNTLNSILGEKAI